MKIIKTMSSANDYTQRAIESIIDLSDEIRHGPLDDTQKKLYNLIMKVFAFSANTIIKLKKETGQTPEWITDEVIRLIEIHIEESRQLDKFK